jgi:HK97 family phage portal protein
MNLFGWRLTREKRNAEDPKYPLSYPNIASLLGDAPTASGVRVTPESAVRLITVYSCVSIIASTLATLPIGVYERREKSRTRAETHKLDRILHAQPNERLTAVTFFEMLQAQLLLWGNAYAEIKREPFGDISLWPLCSAGVTPYVNPVTGRELVYDVRTPDGKVTLMGDQVLHVPGLSFNGVSGLSPVGLAKQSLGLALATEEFGSRLFSNGIKPSGVLEAPNALSDKAYERLQAAMSQRKGLSQAHRELILEEGLKWHSASMNPDDAQFLETRKFQRTEIAALYRVPPHMVGDLERASFSNIEQQSLDFEKHTMRPWIVRWEQEINRKLLAEPAGKYFAKFSVDALLRADIKTRYDAYAIGRTNGWLSANDIRAFEDMNPINGGDQYLIPLNMTPVAKRAVKTRDVYDLLAQLLTQTESEP